MAPGLVAQVSSCGGAACLSLEQLASQVSRWTCAPLSNKHDWCLRPSGLAAQLALLHIWPCCTYHPLCLPCARSSLPKPQCTPTVACSRPGRWMPATRCPLAWPLGCSSEAGAVLGYDSQLLWVDTLLWTALLSTSTYCPAKQRKPSQPSCLLPLMPTAGRCPEWAFALAFHQPWMRYSGTGGGRTSATQVR